MVLISAITFRILPVLVLLLGSASTEPDSAQSIVLSRRSQSHDHHELVKRTWTFLDYNKPFGGNNDSTLIPPWYIVYNMLYNHKKMKGVQTTVLYDDKDTWVHWGSFVDIKNIPETSNVPKSYSFVGMTSDVNQQIRDYSQIPAEYTWTRKNTPADNFKGNVCFDFVISNGPDKKQDHELMLWLEWVGGQGPIGTGQATKRILNLYGQDWTLYEGINEDIHVTVRSLLPDKQYNGQFKGDMKEWLMKLVEAGIFRDDAYLIIANLGMEAFWGHSTFEAHSTLQLLWKGNNHQIGFKPKDFTRPVPGTVIPGFENTG